MAKVVRTITTLYRLRLSASVRQSLLVSRLKSLLKHNWLYSPDYYQQVVEGPAVRSANTIADSIAEDFHVTRLVDVGCGTGALLEKFRDRGCEVFGLEYSEAALKYCHARNLDVAKFNLERDEYTGNRSFDVAVSMEVAEHLPENTANRYLDLLTRLARVIVFTAAPPGQGGNDHVNEQPPDYWITRFQQRGFSYNSELSERWREDWKASGHVEWWYHQNLMIFQRA